MDVICIERFPVKCVIGAFAHERRTKRTVHVSLALHADLGRACRSDRLEDTVDYAVLMRKIEREALSARCRLLEALAERIASVCLSEKLVRKAEVTVEKRGVSRAPVSVRIVRSARPGSSSKGGYK